MILNEIAQIDDATAVFQDYMERMVTHANSSIMNIALAIPTYNNITTLPETLASVVALKGRKNIELILSDDASKDGTREYLVAWVKKNGDEFHGCTLLLNETNLGISGNHACAFEAATSEYGFYIGGDDIVYNPDFIGELARLIDTSRDLRIAKIDLEALYRPGNAIEQVYKHKKYFFTLPARKQFAALALLGNFLYAGPGTILHLPTLREVGGFDPRFRTYEDMPLFNRFLASGYRMRFLDVRGIYWVRASSSLSLAGFSGKREMFEAENKIRWEYVRMHLDRFTWYERFLFKRLDWSRWRKYPFLAAYPSWIRFRFVPSILKRLSRLGHSLT
jgi:glycosyltransferase involved in cell wall biosynthesis